MACRQTIFSQQTLLDFKLTHIVMCEWMIFKYSKFIYFGLSQLYLVNRLAFYILALGHFLTRIMRLKKLQQALLTKSLLPSVKFCYLLTFYSLVGISAFDSVFLKSIPDLIIKFTSILGRHFNLSDDQISIEIFVLAVNWRANQKLKIYLVTCCILILSGNKNENQNDE